jgi:hypothetical protein
MRTAESQREAGPEIVESYRDFEPPANFQKLLHDLLKAVPPTYMVGLKTIVLANQAALNRDQRRMKTWSRNRKIGLDEMAGSYHQATRSSPAAVWLYVDNILDSGPRWLWRVPMWGYFVLSTVLYHEIGHHIHAVHKPVFEGQENVAEDWSRKLSGRFIRSRYWYLLPILYPLALLRKLPRRIKKMIARISK